MELLPIMVDPGTLASTLRLATPLLLACLAGLYAERSGVFDIGLEGKMLAGAFAGAAAASVHDSLWAGLLAAIAVSVGLALVHGFACITQRGNQIVSGVAINFIAAGGTAIIGNAVFQKGGQTPALTAGQRLPDLLTGAAAPVRALPGGEVAASLLLGHKPLVYVAFLMAPVTWWILFRTRFGLRLRAVGENPAAVDTAGISVTLLRYQALVVCGVLTGLAGAHLSMAQNAGFVNNMSAGKGFIALAALIFAKWRPMQALAACLLFGYLDAVAIRLQGVVTWIPAQALNALPFLLVVVLLAGFVGRAIAPKAGGVPYVKER